MTAKQRRSALFDRPVVEDDVVIRSMRLGDALVARLSLFFRTYGLTPLQYNVLRILYVRDPECDGLPTGEVGARLTVRVPDVTRLLDRLEAARLIERLRPAADRRLVKVRLTQAGVALVERIHHPLVQHNRDLFSQFSQQDLEQLAGLLSRAFDALSESDPNDGRSTLEGPKGETP